MSGDFIELVALLALGFLSLLFGGKKKSSSRQQQSRQHPSARASASPPTVRRQVSRPTPSTPRRAPSRPDVRSAGRDMVDPGRSVEDLLIRLGADPALFDVGTDDAEARRDADAERLVWEDDEVETEVVSLETLEPAGGESHERFHEQYITELPPVHPVRQRPHPLARLRGGSALRRAIVWAEILGPPKGLGP